MKALVGEIVDTFETALGPFADPGVVRLARKLPQTLERPDELRVLMQCHRRGVARSQAALVTVVADRLAIAVPDGQTTEWPLADCALRDDASRLGGIRLTITTPRETVVLQRAIPIDEAPRLTQALAGGLSSGTGSADRAQPFSLHPPVARLGAAVVLYEDRISFADGPTHALTAEVRARALELPSRTTTALRSVSRLMQGARGRPRQVLIDGPGWTQISPAPETAPELADTFAAAVNRFARG